jgi:prolyl-tRNA editing enzyme YbaK/EbsC (Cys-tRNA(Pro) deacylase)
MVFGTDAGLLVKVDLLGCLNQPRRAPFGHATQLRVFVDPDLLQYDEVWAAAGTWNDNFGAAPADIVRVAGGVVTDLKRM